MRLIKVVKDNETKYFTTKTGVSEYIGCHVAQVYTVLKGIPATHYVRNFYIDYTDDPDIKNGDIYK